MRNRIAVGTCILAGAGLTAFVGFTSCRANQTTGLKETVADDDRFANLQLLMTGNATTGEITARFSYKGSDLEPGQKVTLRYDVVSNGSGVVKCSALRREASVTLEGEGKEGTFKVRVGPNDFASPIQPHPQGLAKFDTTKSNAVFNGPMQVEGCFMAGKKALKTAGTPVSTGFALEGEGGINGYGAICAQKLGKIPAFSCLDETLFRELPITVTENGQTTTAASRVDQCDRPIYLPTGSLTDNCKPWARIGRIKTSLNAYAAVVCRRYWPEESAAPNALGGGSGIPQGSEGVSVNDQPDDWKRNPSGPNDPFYNDVAIIQYDTKTGETCYFQALGVLYGERVPPPDEATVPAEAQTQFPNAKNAESFWLPPETVANINCINCHDSDPWMHSPYVRQAVDEAGAVFLPSKPKLKNYTMLGGEFGFSNWTQSYLVAPTDGSGDACLGCHHVGSLNGCSSWLTDVGSGKHFGDSKTAFGKAFPQAHWMPPDHGEADAASWEANYKAAVDGIARCCTVPGAELGLKMVGGSPNFFGATARYGKKLSAAKLAILEAAGCKVTPRNTSVVGAGPPPPPPPGTPPATEPVTTPATTAPATPPP